LKVQIHGRGRTPSRFRFAIQDLLILMLLTPLIAQATACGGAAKVDAPTSAASEARVRVREWAHDCAVPLVERFDSGHLDLEPFGAMVGDAPVVALSEGTHLGAEPLEFRNRVLEYLVEEKGFTAIAIESGIVESRAVHDYVLGGRDELASVVASGFSWTFDALPQNTSLVRWLRAYNVDPRHARKVNFYGFDVPGSPGNPHARRGVDTALVEALGYLATVDKSAAAELQESLAPLLRRMRFDFIRREDAPGYETLSQFQRDTLTGGINNLVGLLERNETAYVAADGLSNYTWGHRAAIGAQQVDSWLRQIPLGWQPAKVTVQFPSEQTRFFSRATDVRDRAQADNLEWVIRQEGESGKVLVFAHAYHISAAPVHATWMGADERQVMSTYLRTKLHSHLVTIGNLIGGGSVGCAGDFEKLNVVPRGSLEEMFHGIGSPAFLLDLRSAPSSVGGWFDHPRAIGHGLDALDVPVRRAFDIIYYLDRVTPACHS
jgi:erythromycin esterase